MPEDGTWVPKDVGDFIRENCFTLKSAFVGKIIIDWPHEFGSRR
jgi:hypothetical protein